MKTFYIQYVMRAGDMLMLKESGVGDGRKGKEASDMKEKKL